MKIEQSWSISQRWKNLFFLNYKVDKKELRKILPSYLELDLFEDECFTSVVPFQMSKVRFPFSPSLPFSKLNELNLRTYVKFGHVRGIYFFTLDSNHRLGNWVARNFFNLPYNFRSVNLDCWDNLYNSSSPNLKIKAKIAKQKAKTDFENFIVERYSLFTNDKNNIYRGQVVHDPWELYDVKILEVNESMNQRFNLSTPELVNSFFCQGFDVYFKPFEKVANL